MSQDDRERQLGGNAQLNGLIVWLTGGEPRVRTERLDLYPFNADFGSVTVKAERVRIEQLRTPGAGQPATALVGQRVSGQAVVIAGAGFSVSGARVEAPEGARLKRNGEVLAPELIIEDFRIDISDVKALRRHPPEGEAAAPSGEPAATAGEVAAAAPERPRLEWKILDVLEGHVNVDLLLDFTGPIVGRRQETHKFRIVIENGAIDYDRLEGDLNWVERSFVDIRVSEGALELTRNIPLIPFTGKPLLRWPLDENGLELARRDRVMLRTLLSWELPEEERERRASSGGSRVKLNHIAAQNVDVALALAEPSWLDLGDHGRVQLVAAAEHGPPRASLTGELEHVAADQPRTTKLEAAVGPLEAVLDGIKTGALRISADRLFPERLRGELTWRGTTPGALVIRADRLVARDVRFTPVRRAASVPPEGEQK